MANQCTNKVRITGHTNTSLKYIFLLLEKDAGWLFSRTITHYRNTPHEEKFGVNHDCKLPEKCIISDDLIEFEIETNWTPPALWAKELSRTWRCRVELEYSEPGFELDGLLIFSSGEVIENTDYFPI